MKKMTLKYALFILSTATLLSSCSQNFDALPGNQVTEEDVFKSEEGFKTAANGLYATLQNPQYYGGSMITITELYTSYSAAGGYDDATLTNINVAATSGDEQKLEATNPRLRNIWVAIYNTIRATNIFLSKGKNNNKPDEISADAVWNNLKAQALGIRALAHLDLLRLYGKHWDITSNDGIPVVKYVPTADAKPKRNTVADTYKAILEDLDEAETILTESANQANSIEAVGSGKNYIDLWVIKALKARTYLYKGDKANAILFADAVIANYTADYLATDLSKYYASRNSGSESIFELSFSNQNASALNLTTYKNSTALINDLIAGVNVSYLNDNIFSKTGDGVVGTSQRSSLFEEDRTTKYASAPVLKNNPAYIIRLAEMYLIKAEANNFTMTDLADLRAARGVTGATTANDAEGMFEEIVAELNFEGGHVMCARARLNIDNYKTSGKGIFPIPATELLANPNMVQNEAYK